jgi:hypothetical protein
MVSPVPVGGRRLSVEAHLLDLVGSDVEVNATDDQAWVTFGGLGSLVPFGSSREAQLLNLLAIAKTLYDQASELLNEERHDDE